MVSPFVMWTAYVHALAVAMAGILIRAASRRNELNAKDRVRIARAHFEFAHVLRIFSIPTVRLSPEYPVLAHAAAFGN
jgi:hypothetical protein